MILVTGGTGYLGRALVARLVECGERVRVLSRHPRNVAGELCPGDITSPEQLDKAMQGVQVVYHLAALVDHYAGIERLESVNVQGTRNVLETAVRNRVNRFIHCSSVSAEPGGGSTVYGRSKIAAERCLEPYRQHIPIITIRPGPVYDEERKNLQRLVRFACSSRICPRLLPDVTVHLASRKNVTEAFLLARTSGVPGKAYAICDRQAVNRSVLARIIQESTASLSIPLPIALFSPLLYATALCCEGLHAATGQRPLIDRHYLKVLTRERHYDISPAQYELGYAPAPTELHFAETVQTILQAQRSRRQARNSRAPAA